MCERGRRGFSWGEVGWSPRKQRGGMCGGGGGGRKLGKLGGGLLSSCRRGRWPLTLASVNKVAAGGCRRLLDVGTGHICPGQICPGQVPTFARHCVRSTRTRSGRLSGKYRVIVRSSRPSLERLSELTVALPLKGGGGVPPGCALDVRSDRQRYARAGGSRGARATLEAETTKVLARLGSLVAFLLADTILR